MRGNGNSCDWFPFLGNKTVKKFIFFSRLCVFWPISEIYSSRRVDECVPVAIIAEVHFQSFCCCRRSGYSETKCMCEWMCAEGATQDKMTPKCGLLLFVLLAVPFIESGKFHHHCRLHLSFASLHFALSICRHRAFYECFPFALNHIFLYQEAQPVLLKVRNGRLWTELMPSHIDLMPPVCVGYHTKFSILSTANKAKSRRIFAFHEDERFLCTKYHCTHTHNRNVFAQRILLSKAHFVRMAGAWRIHIAIAICSEFLFNVCCAFAFVSLAVVSGHISEKLPPKNLSQFNICLCRFCEAKRQINKAEKSAQSMLKQRK